MADLNIATVLMVGFVGMIFGFISVIGTMVGLFIWLDKKHSARMDGIDKRIVDLQDDMREMRRDIQVVQRDVQALEQDVKALQREMQAVRRDVQALEQDVKALQLEMQAVQRDIQVIQRDVQAVQRDVQSVQRDMREIHRNMRVLNTKVDRAQGALDVLVFGERGVPPPVARERAETETQVEEPVAD